MRAQRTETSKPMSKHDDALPLPPTPPADGRPHIYVINADPDFLEMVADLLTDTRAQVTLEQQRPNVWVTLENLRSARPNLLILDVVPYRNDARALLETMTADAELAHLPVLTASTSTGAAEQLANAYPDLVREVLPKPFDVGDLLALVSKLIVGIKAP